MSRAFEKGVRFDPEKGVDYDAIPNDPAFLAWFLEQTKPRPCSDCTDAEPCDDCYDENSEVQPFQLWKGTK